MTELEEVVIEIDKQIAKIRKLVAANPSPMRSGMKMAYEDIREYIQQRRKEKGELP